MKDFNNVTKYLELWSLIQLQFSAVNKYHQPEIFSIKIVLSKAQLSAKKETITVLFLSDLLLVD